MTNTYKKKIDGWARPSELLKKGSPSLWGKNGIHPNGINQGSLGDCWFLAACSALAEHPERIRALFDNTGYSIGGVFRTNFYHMNERVKITVDDRFPVNIGKNPRYMSYNKKRIYGTDMSENKAWWVPILEKSYAKLNVNYSQLNSGVPGVAFRELTNMPVEVFYTKDQKPAEFTKIITEADKKGWSMAAACREKHFDLATAHAYTLLGVVELKGGPTLVKMRNPWGSEKYSGPFRDDDPQWTAAWKKQAGLVVANDGIFHMKMSDFHLPFKRYAVAMYQDWKVSKTRI